MKVIVNSTYKENFALKKFIDQLPEQFEKEGILLFSKRNTIKSYSVDNLDPILERVVVKRYKFPNLIQRVVYSFFRSSKAERAFYNARRLRNHEIETPLEIAYIEQKKNGLLGYCYFLSSYDDNLPIRDLILNENFDRTLASDFAGFVAKLHEAGILNHDLNSTNVLYHIDDNQYYFSLIDINRIDFYPEGKAIPQKDCFKNLTRFTGRMDLFEYVIRCYLKKRDWDAEDAIPKAINVKKKHDLRWEQRKAILRKLGRIIRR